MTYTLVIIVSITGGMASGLIGGAGGGGASSSITKIEMSSLKECEAAAKKISRREQYPYYRVYETRAFCVNTKAG